MSTPAKRNLTVFHTNASRIRQLYKNGTLNNAEAQNSLNRIYQHAEKYFYNHMPNNKEARNRNANRLQEIMRWSQGHWNYKSR